MSSTDPKEIAMLDKIHQDERDYKAYAATLTHPDDLAEADYLFKEWVSVHDIQKTIETLQSPGEQSLSLNARELYALSGLLLNERSPEIERIREKIDRAFHAIADRHPAQ